MKHFTFLLLSIQGKHCYFHYFGINSSCFLFLITINLSRHNKQTLQVRICILRTLIDRGLADYTLPYFPPVTVLQEMYFTGIPNLSFGKLWVKRKHLIHCVTLGVEGDVLADERVFRFLSCLWEIASKGQYRSYYLVLSQVIVGHPNREPPGPCIHPLTK